MWQLAFVLYPMRSRIYPTSTCGHVAPCGLGGLHVTSTFGRRTVPATTGVCCHNMDPVSVEVWLCHIQHTVQTEIDKVMQPGALPPIYCLSSHTAQHIRLETEFGCMYAMHEPHTPLTVKVSACRQLRYWYGHQCTSL